MPIIGHNKPAPWALTPAFVDPKWGWVWNNHDIIVPFWDGGSSPHFIKRGQDGIFDPLTSNWTWVITERGPALRTANAGILDLDNTIGIAETGPFTVIAVVGLDSQSTNAINAGLVVGRRWVLRLEQHNNTGNIGFTKDNVVDLASNFNTPTSGTHVIAVTIEADDNPIIYLDGVAEDLSDTQTILTDITGDIRIGSTDRTTANYLTLYLLDNYMATAAEHKQIADDPFGPLRMLDEVRVVAPAAVAVPTIHLTMPPYISA